MYRWQSINALILTVFSIPTQLHFLLQHIWPEAVSLNRNSLLLCRHCRCCSSKGFYLHARRPLHPRCWRRRTHCPKRGYRHRPCTVEAPRPVLWISELYVEFGFCNWANPWGWILTECDLGKYYLPYHGTRLIPASDGYSTSTSLSSASVSSSCSSFSSSSLFPARCLKNSAALTISAQSYLSGVFPRF